MAEIAVKTKIDSVIVYNDRVMVTRICDVRLEAAVDLLVEDLPGALDDQSVRVKAKDLKFGEIQVRTGYAREPSPRVKKIEDQIEKLGIDDRTLVDESAVLAEKQKFLASISVSSPQTISKELFEGKVSADAWRQGLTFMAEESLKARQRIAEIERKRKDLREEIEALKAEMEDINSYAENLKTLVFDVHPEKAQAYHLEISYIIYGATWSPYYDLRANPSLGKVEIGYFGKIRQSTGEDWDDVSVTLSTAQPSQGGNAPEPYPWYVSLYRPEPEMRAKRAAAPMASKAQAEECESVAAGAVMRDEFVPAPPVEAGISVMYPLPGRFTVKSGDAEKKVKIYERIMVADFEYFSVPRVSQSAFLTGEVKNETAYLFLSGEAGTYVGDDFTGRVTMPAIAPEEKVVISFGVDERVKVERKTVKSKVTKGGLVKKVTRYEYIYENLLTNYHDKEIKCQIVDQLPVPQSPEIKIQDAGLEPRPTEEEKDMAIYRWKAQVKPKQEFKITVTFAVEIPPEARIQGL
jgi:uncharacterized protein (TIGR02231 family)